MSATALQEIEASIERLDSKDQVRLLENLAPKIAGAILNRPTSHASGDAEQAWLRYRAVGERLAATSTTGSASLTDAVSQSRR